MADAGRDGHVSSFCDLTGASPEQATEYLSATGWDLETAVASFYADAEEGDSAPTTATPTLGQAADDSYSGPRTLDGRPAPQYASASSSSKKVPKKKGLATLSSLGAGHAHDDDDDDEDEEEDEGRGPRDLFAGGEKSGLAVQDPKMDRGPSSAQKVIKDILSRAKANASRPGPDEEEAGPSQSGAFRGTGQTLGGEGVESRSIPDPLGAPTSRQATTEGEGATQMRTLHLWQDGFSIDDGELRRFDDPAHAMDLQLIRQGRAPLHLMDVRYDQPVDVKLQQHEENWRQLPRIYRPFGGEGRRLGSPVPGDSASGASAISASTAARTATSQPASSRQAPEVDSSQPTIMLRIQLADGTRLPARFNSTHTVGDVYDFVQRASPESTTRDWVLATTFPNRDHTDRGLVLGEMPEFKRGGTAVVKWT